MIQNHLPETYPPGEITQERKKFETEFQSENDSNSIVATKQRMEHGKAHPLRGIAAVEERALGRQPSAADWGLYLPRGFGQTRNVPAMRFENTRAHTVSSSSLRSLEKDMDPRQSRESLAQTYTQPSMGATSQPSGDSSVERKPRRRTKCGNGMELDAGGASNPNLKRLALRKGAPVPNLANVSKFSVQNSSTYEQHLPPTITTSNVDNKALSRLATLKSLWDQGYIDEKEFMRRKQVILNEVTGTYVNAEDYHNQSSSSYVNPASAAPYVLKFPDFRNIPYERALKHIFDYETCKWGCTEVWIKLDTRPFAKGSMRLVYHLEDHGEVRRETLEDGSTVELGPEVHRGGQGYGDALVGLSSRRDRLIAKLAIDPHEDPQTYFRDIELQEHCAFYAGKYNEYNPPKRVEFVRAWVLELTQRNRALCGVERFIQGDYRKHNNNFGFVCDEDRNTPQAFSHFTYEASNHQLLAVDIQGVGDLYTDPQIHTLNGDDFGKGNLGPYGIQRFLSTHRCNPICRYLKLPSNNPKEMNSGTIPVQAVMQLDRVHAVNFESKHYYEETPQLQKFIQECREEEARKARSVRRTRRRRGWRDRAHTEDSGLSLCCAKLTHSCAIC